MEDVQKDQVRAEAVRAKAEEERANKKQVQNEAYLDQVPAWAMEVPKPDGSGLYALGAAEAANWSLARKKAMLEAEFGLAKLYRQELSGSERSYTNERDDKALNTQYTALIDKLVTRVQVVGFEVIKQDVRALHGSFHSWVLLKLPYTEVNQVLKEQRSESMDASVRAAFDDLDKRVNARMAQRTQEQKAQQDMRLTEMSERTRLVSPAAAPQAVGAVSAVASVTASTNAPVTAPAVVATPVP